MHRLATITLVFIASFALAGPHIPAGDTVLRSDIQRPGDEAIITGDQWSGELGKKLAKNVAASESPSTRKVLFCPASNP